MTSGSRGGVAA